MAAKRKRGRPKGSGAGLSERLEIKVTPELLKLAGADAKRAGLTESEWWRRAAFHYIGSEPAAK